MNEIIEAAMIYRTHNGQWPMDICTEQYLIVPTPNPLSDDCNGDGAVDFDDFSGVRRLFREGYIPLGDWRTELTSSDDFSAANRARSIPSVIGGKLVLHPVTTTGTHAWRVSSPVTDYASFASSIATEADRDAVASRQGLRLYMELPAPFACLAHYIVALVPSAQLLVSGNPFERQQLRRS